MKRTLLALSLLITGAAATAAPIASADVDAATAKCGVYLDAPAGTLPTVLVDPIAVPVTTARPSGKYCEYDVGTLANGAHTVAFTAFTAPDAVGRATESAKSNVVSFPLPLPPAPTAPAVPQNPKLRMTAG